jgi:hypothetical protein
MSRLLIVNLRFFSEILPSARFYYDKSADHQINVISEKIQNLYTKIKLKNNFDSIIMIANEHFVRKGLDEYVLEQKSKEFFLTSLKTATARKNDLVLIAGTISYESKGLNKHNYDRTQLIRPSGNSPLFKPVSPNYLPPVDGKIAKNSCYIFYNGNKLNNFGKINPFHLDIHESEIANMSFLAGRTDKDPIITLPTNPPITCVIEICADHLNGVAKAALASSKKRPLIHFILSNPIDEICPENFTGEYTINADFKHSTRTFKNFTKNQEGSAYNPELPKIRVIEYYLLEDQGKIIDNFNLPPTNTAN